MTIDLDTLVRATDDQLTYYPAMSKNGRPVVTVDVIRALADSHPSWTPPNVPENGTVSLADLGLELIVDDPAQGLGAHIYLVAPGRGWLLCSECGPLGRISGPLSEAGAACDLHNRDLRH